MSPFAFVGLVLGYLAGGILTLQVLRRSDFGFLLEYSFGGVCEPAVCGALLMWPLFAFMGACGLAARAAWWLSGGKL